MPLSAISICLLLTLTVWPARAEELASSYWFKRAIESEARLAEATTDEDKIVRLRRWVYANMNRASRSLTLEGEFGVEVHNAPPYEVMLAAKSKGLGYLCGGTAYVLAQVYEMFGYSAGVLNAGGDRTHVVTLVELPFGKVSVQDAYFGNDLRKRGELADFGNFLTALNQGGWEEFEFVTDADQSCKPTVRRSEEWVERQQNAPTSLGPIMESNANRTTRCQKFTLAEWLVTPGLLQALERRTGHADFRFLFTMPLGATGIARRYVECPDGVGPTCRYKDLKALAN